MRKRGGLLVLGNFGYENNQLDGQTIKTRNVYELVTRYKSEEVEYFDTQCLHKRPWMIVKLCYLIIGCNTLLYLPAQNNLRYFLPVIYLLSKLFSYSVVYIMIGGWLPEFLTTHNRYLKYIASMRWIFAETERVQIELEKKFDLKNVGLLHNFRMVDTLYDGKVGRWTSLRIVFMARIMKQKGLDYMFALAQYICENDLSRDMQVDFYGQIAKDDKPYFEENLKKYSSCSHYMGELQPNEIYETLSHYDVLALPTHFYTEGFPGSILDAYISGIPVVVTEWKHAHEFVKDSVTGIIVPFENGEGQFVQAFRLLYREPKFLQELKINVRDVRKNYMPQHIWQVLQSKLA